MYAEDSLVMKTVAEQFSKLAGEAMARGKEREEKARFELLMMEFKLLELELDLFLAGGPIPGENDE